MSYWDHIFVNPFDGKVTSYHAESMYDKIIYRSTKALIKAQFPELLSSYKKCQKKKAIPLLDDHKKNLDLADDKCLIIMEHDYDTDIYKLSNRMKELQTIYDFNLISSWEPSVIPYSDLNYTSDREEGKMKTLYRRKAKEIEPQRKKLRSSEIPYGPSILGKTNLMSCGLKATVIEYNSITDFTVQYEDGKVIEHVNRGQFKKGTVPYPEE